MRTLSIVARIKGVCGGYGKRAADFGQLLPNPTGAGSNNPETPVRSSPAAVSMDFPGMGFARQCAK
jgi:hypothetical protein